jgi:transcriptional regulator with XRE-family HTH domain
MTPYQIGAALRKERLSRKWKWHKVAQESRMTIGQVQSIENATKAYTIDSLVKVCKALDCELVVRPIEK